MVMIRERIHAIPPPLRAVIAILLVTLVALLIVLLFIWSPWSKGPVVGPTPLPTAMPSPAPTSTSVPTVTPVPTVTSVPSAQLQTLPISKGDTWKYLKGTAEPPSNWKEASFNDAQWSQGKAPFGYGDPYCQSGTALTDMQGRYVSLYTRKLFRVDNSASIQKLVLQVDYDDAFVAYLNGREVAYATNIARSPAYNALATAMHESSRGDTGPQAVIPLDITSNRDVLVSGANVLAVQVHNVTLDSSDLCLETVLTVESGTTVFPIPTPEPTPTRTPSPVPTSTSRPAPTNTPGPRPFLDVKLTASSSIGFAPLNGVDLTARITDGNQSGPVKYKFACGTGDDLAPSPALVRDSTTYTAENRCSYQNPGTYNAKVLVEQGRVSVGGSIQIEVKPRASVPTPTPTSTPVFQPTLRVSLSANPSVGPSPLRVSLTATVSGTATGSIFYQIDCNGDGWDKELTSDATSLTVSDLCTYPQGNHLARVLVTRGGQGAGGTASIIAQQSSAVPTPTPIPTSTPSARPTLGVSMRPSPFAGSAPLRVTLNVTVSGTATGTIVYRVDCTGDGSWEKQDVTDQSNFTLVDVCTYNAAGTYRMVLQIERQGQGTGSSSQIVVR